MTQWTEYVGSIHMHTDYSDGTGTVQDIVDAARRVGLDFVILTDHNVLPRKEEGWRQQVLTLISAEVHDPARQPQGNHLLCLGIKSAPLAAAGNPQALINAVAAQGGLTFLAHPDERSTALIPDSYPWFDWWVTDYTGLELWNYMTELRQYTTNHLRALLVGFLPAAFSTGPLPETLAHWDQLCQQRPVVGIGGTDVHALHLRAGPFRRVVYPYAHCFRTVSVHLLCEHPFTNDLAHDRTQVYTALRAGHCWIGYEWLGNTRGFRFAAQHDDGTAIMGDTVAWRPELHLRAELPALAELRLLRNGAVIVQTRGRTLAYAVREPGVYRLEAWRRAYGQRRGWIFSNPIYVR